MCFSRISLRAAGAGHQRGRARLLGFGVAASLGSIVFDRMAARIGAGRAISIDMPVQALSLLLAQFWSHPVVLAFSTAAAGFTVLGATALALV